MTNIELMDYTKLSYELAKAQIAVKVLEQTVQNLKEQLVNLNAGKNYAEPRL